MSERNVVPAEFAVASGAVAPPQPRERLRSLKTRAEFLRVRGGVRWSGRAFVVEGRRRDDARGAEGLAVGAELQVTGRRFGFTVTKKIGNAVVRNRARRRLREAVRSALGQSGVANSRADSDYVVVARADAGVIPFGELANDMMRALVHIDHKLAARRHDTGQRSGRMTEHTGERANHPGDAGKPPRTQRDDGSRNR